MAKVTVKSLDKRVKSLENLLKSKNKEKNDKKLRIFSISVLLTIVGVVSWYFLSGLITTKVSVNDLSLDREIIQGMITVNSIVFALSTFLYEQYGKADYESKVWFRRVFTACTVLSGISLLIWIGALISSSISLWWMLLVLAFLGPVSTVIFYVSIGVAQVVNFLLEKLGFSVSSRNH